MGSREKRKPAKRASKARSGKTEHARAKKANGAHAKKANGAAHAKASTSKANGSVPPGMNLTPVEARPSRSERAEIDQHLSEIDEVLNAWADVVAERISADQEFADLVEEFQRQPRDLRGLFSWDALQAAEARVEMINDVLAHHIKNRRADPTAILADLRQRRQRVAAVYAVNAFLAVLNQMKPRKPKWVSMDDVDPRFAVLALAHQTLAYALDAAHVEAPPDLTEHIILATQDETVWVWRRMPEPGTDTLAACAAAAAFFRSLGSDVLDSTDAVAALYAEHSARTEARS